MPKMGTGRQVFSHNVKNVVCNMLDPVIAAHAYSAKRHYFDNKSLIIHRPKPELSIAENLLRMLSKSKEFTEEHISEIVLLH